MFSKKFTTELSRIIIYAFVAALVYPISAVVSTALLPQANAAVTATATSTTDNFWVNIAESATATTNTSATNSTTKWTQITPTSIDDGYSEIISANQTCSLSTNNCKATDSNWSFTFAGVQYSKVFFSSNNYITFGGGSGDIPSYINTIKFPGLMLCGADRYVYRQLYLLDAAGNLHLRMEGYDYNSSFSSTPAFYEITLLNGTSTMRVAVGLFTPSPTSGRPCYWNATPTASNTSAGLMNSATPGTTSNTLLQTFPTGASLQYTTTVFTTSNGPTLESSRGNTVSTNVNVTLYDTITASGGNGATTITMDTPTAGASFDSVTGVFRLTRSDSVTVTQTFTARDSQNATSTLTVTFVVNALPTNTQTNTTLTTTLGRTAQETMTVVGGTAPYRFVKTSSNAQVGITMETTTTRAVLKVAASNVVAGTTTETITCTDAVGSVTVAVFRVVISPALTLSNSKGYNVPITTGTAITETITASGGTSPISYVLTGTLTSGNIFLDTSTASSGYVYLKTLSGLAAGTYYETVTATDSRSATSAVGMKLTVTAPAVIGGGSTSTFSMNQGTTSYDTLTVTGGSVPLTYSLTSSPANAGILIGSSSNTQVVLKFLNTVLSGTYTLTLTSTDSASATTTHTVTLTVGAPLEWTFFTAPTLTATLGTAKSLQVSTTGGGSNKAFTLTQGARSSRGITLDTTTASSGYVTLNVNNRVSIGTYFETITATDATGRRISTMITVNIVAPVAMTYSGTKLTDGYSSLQFDGSTQYLSLPASTKYQMGNTFTVEWWQYETDTSTNPTIFSLANYWGLYFDTSGTSLKLKTSTTTTATLASGLTAANYKNRWTHFALVSNAGVGYLYIDGKAINATALSIPSVTNLNVPGTIPACIGARCSGTTGTSGYYFGGSLANFSIAKRVDYTGTSTTSTNFTPGTTLKIDSATVIALFGLNSSSSLYDFSDDMDTVTAYGSPTGSLSFPNLTTALPILIQTTEGRARFGTSVGGIAGIGDVTFTSTVSTPGVIYTSRPGVAYFSFAETATATNSTTPRSVTEYLTGSDSNGSQTTVPIAIKIHPPMSYTATAINPVIPALVNYSDTITVFASAGVNATTRTNPAVSSIYLDTSTETQTVINVRSTTPVGTYYETITTYGIYGDSATIVITITVTPGLSLSASDSATSLTTTSGYLGTLRINAINGSGSKTFTLAHVGSSTSNFITLDTSTASSDYVTLRVGSGGTVPAGTYSERITVVDSVGSTTYLTISVTVNAAPTISYNSATSGAITLTTTAGKAITSGAFTAALGTGARTLSLSGLNSGITIDTSTANTAYVAVGSSLTATNSTTAKSYYETLTVTDSLGATSLRAFTVVVNPAIVETATATTLTTTSGVAITDTVTATYGTGTKTFTITTSPSIAGITNTTNIANQTTFTVPKTVGPGTYTVTVTATDSVGATTSIDVTLIVNSGLNITGSNSIAMTTGYAYNTSTYSVSGGTGTFRYALTGTLSSSYISLETLTATSFRLKMTSNTPSGSGVAATYYESVTVTDAAGGSISLNITLTVNPVVTLSGTQTINTTFGVASTNVFQTSGGTAPFYVQGASLCAPVRTVVGDYTLLSFVASGSCSWVAPAGVDTVTALVVGGGASGDRGVCAVYWGHGGGGGQVKEQSASITAGTTYNVVVGAGGALGTNCNNIPRDVAGNNGGNSAFGAITASGGVGATVNGAVGGSSYDSNGTLLSGGTPIAADGRYAAGAGAGAGGAGTRLDGGPGITSTITGLMYGSGGPGRSDTVFGNYSPGAQPVGTTPNPNSGAGGSDFTTGGSGVVVIKYLTPSISDRTRFDIYTDTNTASSAKIVVSIPDSVTVGTYVQTFTVKDSVNSSTTYTVNMVVAKATPTVEFSIPGGGSSATYGTPVALTATSSTSGKFTFKKGSSNITGCVDQQTTGGTATCNWTPTDTSTVTMSAAFTPNDLINYNTVTTSNFTLSVLQADTLTVTFTDQNLTFSESGTAVSRAFTLLGVASIDTVTAVSTAITGTANDSTAVNVTGTATSGAAGTSTVTKAGIFSLSGTGLTFSGSTKASYYKAIAYTPGVITINKASNTMSVLYGSANTVTYKPIGTETATVSYKGTGTKSFATTSSTYCSVDATSGALTTVQAGSCDVQFSVSDGPNYLGDTITATVRINKAARTITAASAAASLKYGETTTVTYSVSAETSTASISISTGSTNGCSVDIVAGVLTAVSGTATCSFTAVVGEGTNYLGATSNTVSVTLSKADAPVLTLTPPANVDYLVGATSSSMPEPTFNITGLKLTDTLTALSGITINYVATGTYSYNSTTVPVNANTYTLTPSAISLSSGDISNYNTPTYSGVAWTINQINQDSLTVQSLFQEGITVPFDIQYAGGTTGGTVSGAIISGGTATNCYFVGRNLRANSTGTCLIQLTMLGNQNYRAVSTDVTTVLIAKFVQNTFNFDAPPSGTAIVLNSQVPFTVGPEACTADCQPTITDISPMAVSVGNLIVITGTNFTGADTVIFNRNILVTTFQIDNNGTTITVSVPTSAVSAEGAGSVTVRNAGKPSFRFSGLTFYNPPALG